MATLSPPGAERIPFGAAWTPEDRAIYARQRAYAQEHRLGMFALPTAEEDLASISRIFSPAKEGCVTINLTPEISMSSLLPVSVHSIGSQTINAVDGRTLHGFLEVGKVFRAWMPEMFESFGFQEHIDYEVVSGLSRPDSDSAKARPQETKEYIISLPMAKELAMVQRTAKGKQARQYFLECERRAQSSSLNPANISRLQLITMAMEAEQERLALSCKVEELAPKADALDRIATADGSMCLTNAAKALQINPKRLTTWLHEIEWIYRRAGSSVWTAHQPKLRSGHLVHKVTTVSRTDGTEKVVEQVLVTAKGLATLAKLMGGVA